MKKHRVIFNSSGIYQETGGIIRYCNELQKILIKNSEFDVLTFPKIDIKKKRNKFFSPGTLRNLPFAYNLKKIYEDYIFKKFIEDNEIIDIYHETNFIFKPFKRKKILTVHDLSWTSHPNFHPKNRVIFMEKNFEKNLSEATAIIAVSNYVKEDIVNKFNIPVEKIFVTHLGCSTNFKNEIDQIQIQKFLNINGLEKNKFFLVTSTIEPRKNILNTIKAFNNLNLKKNDFKLAIVGSLGWKYEEILDLINKSKEVVYLKNLNDEELNILLLSQKACIFNSFAEGFGLPIIESMKFSKPVITSNNTSMKEIAENYAMLNNPNDIDGLTKKMNEIINNDQLYDYYSKKSKDRSNKFTWAECGKKTLEIYKHVLKIN